MSGSPRRVVSAESTRCSGTVFPGCKRDYRSGASPGGPRPRRRVDTGIGLDRRRENPGLSCSSGVRTLHRPGPPRRGPRPGRGEDAQPQLHRDRAHPARPRARAGRRRRQGAREPRHLPRGRASAGRGDHRPGPGGADRSHPVHAPRQEGPGALAPGGPAARPQLHRHRAHPARPDPRGRGRRGAGPAEARRRPRPRPPDRDPAPVRLRGGRGGSQDRGRRRDGRDGGGARQGDRPHRRTRCRRCTDVPELLRRARRDPRGQEAGDDRRGRTASP